MHFILELVDGWQKAQEATNKSRTGEVVQRIKHNFKMLSNNLCYTCIIIAKNVNILIEILVIFDRKTDSCKNPAGHITDIDALQIESSNMVLLSKTPSNISMVIYGYIKGIISN